MTRIEKPDTPIGLMINEVLDLASGQLSNLSNLIGYPVNNLWAVYHGYRKMPIVPLVKLCHLMMMNTDEAVALYASQPKPKPQPKKKTESKK
jgi:hypothetical protein